MYAMLSLVLAASFAGGFLFLSARVDRLQLPLLTRFRRSMLCAANQAVFFGNEETSRWSLAWARIACVIATCVFAAILMSREQLVSNHPRAIAQVLFIAMASILVSGAVVYIAIALLRFLPDLRASATLSRCGFRGLWVFDQPKMASYWPEDFHRKLLAAERMDVIDVTGHRLFGPDAKARDGVLTSIAKEAPDCPIRVLLFNPMSTSQDPDRLHATVYQSVLGEMQLQASSFMKKVRETLRIIDELNSERAPEAHIQVRFFDEKPTLRVVMSESTSIVSPWDPRAEKSNLPCLEVVSSEPLSFYESFRRTFERMWQNGICQTFPG